MSLIQLE